MWDPFGYASLFKQSKAYGLTAEDQALFASFKTKDFELVLERLLTAEAVLKALGEEDDVQMERLRVHYDSISDALIAAVLAVHVAWSAIPNRTLQAIRRALLRYRSVYSTNYDLVRYREHPLLRRVAPQSQ